MSGSYWKQVHAEGLAVPSDRPLDDLTAELTRMLGSPDPAQRDGTAYPTLATWIDRGVYDDLLAGLGDGMAAGAPGRARRDRHRLGVPAQLLRAGPRRVHRPRQRAGRCCRAARSSSGATGSPPGCCASATCAASCPARAGRTRSRTARTRSARSRESPHLATNELTVVLDVIADRLLLPVDRLFTAGEPDRLALATMKVLRRNRGPAAGARAVDRPARGRGGTALVVRRPRPVPRRRQRRGVPARAVPAARARAPAAGGPLRPAARASSTR